jgi:Flp pilus assembly CpaE family ATPase
LLFPDRQRRSGPAKIEALLLDLGLPTGAGASLFSSLPPKWALDRDNHDA